MKLIQNKKGETLLETLVAILILTVSAMLLAEVTASSTRINLDAEKVDKKYREDLEKVEKRETPISGEVTIKSGGTTYTYDVNYYGDKSGFTSYATKEGGI
ncbi:type IV pilus modification PilV family protein [Anaerotignum sp.]|uniref:type IV pilus modification PilV family protein n=1 Tax=Anaerotignum sp. TaxID=2039241 RepID=UPI002899D624|nr:type II secretion system protein [Anaerotignum sp.]